MTLTGPDRDEVFNWDPSEPELMRSMIMAGVQIQMPIGTDEKGNPIFPKQPGTPSGSTEGGQRS